jgi:hypothetical protein
MLTEESEDGGFTGVLDRNDLVCSIVRLEAGGQRSGRELVEVAVDLELARNAGVTVRLDVPRELRIADHVAVAVGAEQEVGLADQLARIAIEGNARAEPRLVDDRHTVADRGQGLALTLLRAIL